MLIRETLNRHEGKCVNGILYVEVKIIFNNMQDMQNIIVLYLSQAFFYFHKFTRIR